MINYFTNYLSRINWDAIISSTMQAVLAIIGISLLFFVINLVGKKIIKKTFTTDFGSKKQLSSGRVKTIFTLVNNIFHYTVLFFYFYAILSLLGVPVGTLITSAGIASVALGLGAQGFVTDVVTGFFILLEQQFDVGDAVVINNVSGIVTAIGLRTTQVTSSDGTLNFIPNRNITVVANQSRNNMKATIDVALPDHADVKKMSKIIVDTNKVLAEKYADLLIEAPVLFGTVTTSHGTLALRVFAFTQNGEQLRVQAKFLEAYIDALTKAGFNIPTMPLNLSTK